MTASASLFVPIVLTLFTVAAASVLNVIIADEITSALARATGSSTIPNTNTHACF